MYMWDRTNAEGLQHAEVAMSECNSRQTEQQQEKQARIKHGKSFERRWVDGMLRELKYKPKELARWQRFARS
jgi:hypothetical protein